MGLGEQLVRPHGATGTRLVAAIAVAAGGLLTGAVVGGILVSRPPATVAIGAAPDASASEVTGVQEPSAGGVETPAAPGAAPTGDASDSPGAITGNPRPGTTARPAPGTPHASTPTTGPTSSPTASPTAAPTDPGTTTASPGDRTGVSDSTVAWGVHAPITINGVPLNIAEDPLNGLEAYVEFINQSGGVHGRTLDVRLVDDGYTVDYARRAADTLINEQDNFLVSGTLGVDQIAVVATEAQRRGVPYMAAGGAESSFAALDIHQYGVSYDTAMVQLARFLATEPMYAGRKVGVTALDSPYIAPAVEVFRAEAARVGVEVVEVVTIQKPDQQTSYLAQIQALKRAGAEVVVPVQDPVSTSRIVAECRTQSCEWDWSFSNFVHDTDTALALMQGDWTGVRGVSYFCSHVHPNADDPRSCAAMGEAHRQWAAIRGESDWQENGQSGAFGYQAVSAWVGALRQVGPDLTRERFLAALRSYDGYADLITGPITFAGESTYAHGAESVVVLEAQPNFRWAQITNGLADQF